MVSDRSRSRPFSPNEKGSLLLTGLLIIMVMAGIAAIAARNVMVELRSVGNYRTTSLSAPIAFAGCDAVAMRAMMNPDGFLAFVKNNGNQLTMSDISPTFYNMTESQQGLGPQGSFGYETSAVNQPANFVTTFSEAVTTYRAPGVAQQEGYTYQRYKAETRGLWGSQTITTTDDVLRNAETICTQYIYLGPKYTGGQGGI
jgi:hypothetical protein